MNLRFLSTPSAQQLYAKAERLPIIDYHCHLSPREIYEDRPFENLWQLWLSADHYKWRLMRSYGIDEAYITGDASPYEKYEKFCLAVSNAPGNPLYHWVSLELEQVFGITEPVCPENAAEIWEGASHFLRQSALSPRKLIEKFRVEYIATTDDITDSLIYHKKLQDSAAPCVCPTYRMDGLVLALKNADTSYLEKLGKLSGVSVTDSASLLRAMTIRLDAFCRLNSTLADVGVCYFPNSACSDVRADELIRAIVNGNKPDEASFDGLLGWLYHSFFPILKEKQMVLQLHLGVFRNASDRLFALIGADAGGDCIAKPVYPEQLARLFNALEQKDGLPRTIVYTLSPESYYDIAVLAGAFRNVTMGAAWWFCDHLSGIRNQLQVYSELASLGRFTGMLTDSRSFLSYVRHDYFRRILADFLGGMVEKDEFPMKEAERIMLQICYKNPKQLTCLERRLS